MYALALVGVQCREHVHMPLSELVDPRRQVGYVVGVCDDSVKMFLKMNKKTTIRK